MPKHYPLKIAVFSDSVLPILNGVSVSIDAFVHELRQKGHSVHIFTSNYPRYKDSDPNTHRFFSIKTPWTKDYPLAVPPFGVLLPYFLRESFDIVHTHTPWTLGYVGLTWSKICNIPVVSTYHTLYHKYSHYIPYLSQKYSESKIIHHTKNYYNQIKHVITPSVSSANFLASIGVNTPIKIIPTSNTLYKPYSKNIARNKLNIHPNTKILLYVGRLAQEKNIPTLIHMASLTIRQDPSIHLWLVGDGPYRKTCVNLARELGIGDKVKFVGFIPREELGYYYSAADIFVFASQTETQGLVVQEAMSYGLPAIVVKGGGAEMSIQENINGFSVENIPEAMQKKVSYLFNNKDFYNKISFFAKYTNASYTVSHMVQDILKIYYKALGNPIDQSFSTSFEEREAMTHFF